MKGKNVANHLHRYKKVNLASHGKEPFLVYRCTKPSCSHYIRLDMAEGRLCECNRCGQPMLIGRETLTKSSGKPMALPHCSECIQRRNTNEVANITAFLEQKASANPSEKETDGDS
jgi:hypothetical protein